ncbi:MAG: DUF1444 family protein [Pseudomonadota bacterium]
MAGFLSGLFGGGKAGPPLSQPERFRDHIIQQIATTRPGLRPIDISGPLGIVIGKAPALQINLDNMFAFYLDDPSRLPALIEGHMAALDESWATRHAPAAPPKPEEIVATIRPADLITSGEDTANILHAPLTDDLIVALGIDRKASFQYLTRDDGAELGLEGTALFNRGKANLMEVVTSLSLEPEGLLMQVMADGFYDASLILNDRFWLGIEDKIGGELVFAIPAQNMLLLADARDHAALAQLCELSKACFESAPKPLSPTIYRRDGDDIVPAPT